MAKMKWGSDIDWRGLNDEEYEEGQDYDDYEGEIPPSNTVLRGVIKKVWIAETRNDDPMLKVLFEARGNTGAKKQYDGCPIWDQVLFSMPQVKFRWQPFFDAVGFTLADLKNKTLVGDEDDNIGLPVLKIGTIVFNNEKKPVEVSIKTKREKYEGNEQARVQRWIPARPIEDDDEEDWDEDDVEETPF